MKKFYNYLKDSNFIATVLIIIACSITYSLRENIEFKSQTVTFINLIMSGVFLILCFNSSRKHYIQWSYLICNLSLLFVFNGFYDKRVFFETFHVELLYFCIIVGIIVTVVIMYPLIKRVWVKIITRIFNLLEKWTDNKTAKNEKYYKKEEEKIKHEKSILRKQKKENDKETDKIDKTKDKKTDEIDKTKDKKTFKDNRIIYFILFSIIFIVLLFITIILFFTFTRQGFISIKEMFDKDFFTTITSVVMVFILMIFVAGIMVSLFVKWIDIIIAIITKQHEGELYFIYACCLFIISQYIFDNYSYTEEDFIDFILDGGLFTFPLVLSILIPIFLIFTESIVGFTKNNSKIKEKLDNFMERISKIVEEILDSLFLFIEFVTSDYLSTIIKFTKEDDDKEDN